MSLNITNKVGDLTLSVTLWYLIGTEVFSFSGAVFISCLPSVKSPVSTLAIKINLCPSALGGE